MAEPTKFEPLNAALNKRLDELFDEDGPDSSADATRRAVAHPLAELKKAVLAIDWEITPEALDGFLDQIHLLKEIYRDDKVILILLQMLGSLGRYTRSSHSKVYPSTFGVLNSVFARLEDMVNTPQMPAAVRHRLLQKEVDAFQELRAKIMKRRAARPAAGPVAAARSGGERPTATGPVTAEMLERVAAELKEMIRSEMRVLRELLTALLRR